MKHIFFIVILSLTVANGYSEPKLSDENPNGNISIEAIGEDKKQIMDIDPATIADDAFVRIRDGHLWSNGKRLKLWGAQGGMGLEQKQIDLEVKRFRSLGFNLFRSINVTVPINESEYDYTPGDKSRMDRLDYTFAAVAKSGGYLWLDMVNGFRIAPSDVNSIDDPDISRQDWLSSIEELKDARKGSANLQPTGGLMYWDIRSKEAYMRYIDKMMTHRNPYTGLTYAQDPSVAVIELMNEQWWMPRALGGAVFKNLPRPLMQSLLTHWNNWLAEKYKNTVGLKNAWGGLLPSESLENQTVLLQPLMGKVAADKMSSVLGISADYAEGAVIEVPESKRRKEDVVQFLLNIHIDFCKDAIARIRSHGAPERGASVVPIVIDTGASYAMQSQYEHTFGSALASATYVHQIDADINKSTYPWLASLKNPPYFNGWIDQNKIEGHPSFIYELMFFAPGKYRADFALRLLGLATIQDFDVIVWHYYRPYYDHLDKEPLRMPTGSHYWEGVIFGNDEVALSTMMLGANIFQYGDLQPPPRPTVLAIGEDFLYDMDNLHWGKFSQFLSPTTFEHGLRLRFDPTQKESKFIGPYSDGSDVPGIVRPTPQISYHWKDGYMVIESERVRLVAGFLPENFTFSNGEILSDIAVYNPEGTPYVIPDERYVCFAMCSRDEKPLKESSNIIAMAVSTSWNTGFQFDVEKWSQLQQQKNHPPLNAAKVTKRGSLPILVSRVGWTFNAPWLKGMKAKHFNLTSDCYKQQDVDAYNYTITSDEELFYIEFTK